MRFFILIVVGCTINSCIYSPDETNWVERKSPENVEFYLNLGDYNDTIPIVRNNPINYDFDVGFRQI